MSRTVVTVDALVVGAGPAGLAAAAALKAGGVGRVLVVEREDEPGGTPRLCDHTGFGLGDLRRVLHGPAYARRWVDRVLASGVDIRTRAMVTGWAGPRKAEVTSPDGLLEVAARAVVLATGARERPRSARLVPGTRPSGIFTTGQLQQWVHAARLPLYGRALVVGAEHVSYSAVLTLRDAGVRPVALVTDLPRTQTFRLFDLFNRVGLRVPVWTGSTVAGIAGREKVEGASVRGPDGIERTVPVDAVVFSGDFVPDSELARLGDLSIDAGTRGPAADADGRTTDPGIFAAGNLVHPAETAEVVTRRARFVGHAAATWLRRSDDATPAGTMVHVRVAEPLLWVVPNLAEPGRAGEGPVLVRTRTFLDHPRLDVTQGGRSLASYRIRRMIPNRSHSVGSDWLPLVQPGQDVEITVVPQA